MLPVVQEDPKLSVSESLFAGSIKFSPATSASASASANLASSAVFIAVARASARASAFASLNSINVSVRATYPASFLLVEGFLLSSFKRRRYISKSSFELCMFTDVVVIFCTSSSSSACSNSF